MEPNMDHPHHPPPGHGHPPPQHGHYERTTAEFFNHASARRIDTQCVIATTLKRQYPNLELTIAPIYSVNLLGFAAAGHATITPLSEDLCSSANKYPTSLSTTSYVPPTRRIDNSPGFLVKDIIFAKYLLKWQSKEFILYIVDGRDGASAYPHLKNNYILAPLTHLSESLLLAAGKWSDSLLNEIWVYDHGRWEKSRELWESIQGASWENVILDGDMKEALIQDHLNFFESKDTYKKLKVPWKRGVIYWGPPGNGKTISIKAMMKTLLGREDSVPSLYVRSLVSVSAIYPSVDPEHELGSANRRSTPALNTPSRKFSKKPASSPPATSSLKTSTPSLPTTCAPTSSTKSTASNPTTASS